MNAKAHETWKSTDSSSLRRNVHSDDGRRASDEGQNRLKKERKKKEKKRKKSEKSEKKKKKKKKERGKNGTLFLSMSGIPLHSPLLSQN